MKRFALLALAAAALVVLSGVAFYFLADDPSYQFQELVFRERFRRYDDLITAAAGRYEVPPELIKAVIWRESRFQPHMVGQDGERGLMQITEGAAADWVKAEKIETFAPTDLFDPKVNIEAGTWYLKRALSHWGSKDDPVPFALAEYNAGRTRVRRWVADGQGSGSDAEDLRIAMDFPLTKAYVAAIAERSAFYERRGEFAR